MEIRTVVFCCALFAAVAAFTLPKDVTEYNSKNGLLRVAGSNGCKCKNGRCVTDNRGKTKCNCKPGYALQDESTCEKCDCGEKGRCMFIAHPKSVGGIQYEKKCLCDVGSAEKDGQCIDCHCGENSKCEFEGDEKVCYCIEGYSEKKGVCTKCDCGFNGECKFENGQKKCTCDEGYLVYDDYCKECDCGDFGKCSLVGGKKTCACDAGFSNNDGTCEECDCGVNSLACGFNDGVKNCTCKAYFAQHLDQCVDCKCGPQSYGCRFAGDKKLCNCLEDFVQKEDDTCRLRCSAKNPCHNGGICEDGICKCLPGTSDEFCRVIDDCENLCPNRPDVQCAYNPWKQQSYCKCVGNERLGYHEESRECRPTCDEDTYVCQNGGKCVEKKDGDNARFCHCLDGTESFYCEVIPECDRKDCGHAAKCQYDTSKLSAVCKCHEAGLEFDPEDRTCKQTCRESSDCKNGGTCVGSDSSSSFCRCLDGTKGDFCEDIPGCYAMDCGTSAKCVYDAGKRMAVCECDDPSKAFDPIEYKCRRVCHDSSDCKNGGECTGDKSSRFCRCLKGTDDDYCEKIVGCEAMDCGPEASCTFDIEMKSPTCACNDKTLSFDPIDVKCKRACHDTSDCYNGGICNQRSGYSHFCDCLDGTKGDACEEVVECDVKDCGSEAKCLYDVERRTAVCLCVDKNLQFDPLDNRCKRACHDTSDCLNGGSCKSRDGYSHFCDCLDGTKGDACEEVVECDAKNCGYEAKCVYDVNRRTAVCLCDNQKRHFDPEDNRCRKTCEEELQCQNGGKCSSRGYYQFCDCLPGTSGDLCEIVDECEKEFDMCKGESRCSFDIAREKAHCECLDEKQKYDLLDGKCKETCDQDAVCKNGGLCMHRGDYLFCQCKVGTSGTFCEIVDDCERGVCGDREQTVCEYDIDAEKVKCGCKDPSSLYDLNKKECLVCDCGSNAVSCSFERGQKVCVCKDGYAAEDGTCKKKWCTEKKCLHGKCEVFDEEEVCSCYEGYVLDGDYCQKLNCSRTRCTNGTCIVRRGNIEQCVCPAGYTLRGGECIRGLCRMDTCFGGRCQTIDGELMCVCPERYNLEGIGCFETVCKIQHCFGGKCVVKNDEEICTCPDNHILVGNVCKRILCEKKNCFGGVCNIVDGEEVCTCPPGFTLFEDVCREVQRKKTVKHLTIPLAE